MEKRNRKAGSRYSLRDRILAQIMIVLVTVTMLPYESLVVHAASTTTVKSIGSIQTEYEVDNGTSKDDIGLPSSLSVTIETVTSAEGATEETAPAVSEETVDKSVSWHGDYDGSTAGTYALTASFDDSSLSYSNMPTVHVTVKEAETEPEPTTPEVNKTEDEDGDDDEDPDQGKSEEIAPEEETTPEENADEEETEEVESAKKDALKSPQPPETVTGRERTNLADFAPDNMSATITHPDGSAITEPLHAGDLFNLKLEFHEKEEGIQFSMDTLRYKLPNGAKAVPPLYGDSTVSVIVTDEATGTDKRLYLTTRFRIEQSDDPSVPDVIVYEWNHEPEESYDALCIAENARLTIGLQMMVNGEGDDFEFDDDTLIPVDLTVGINVIKENQINGDHVLTAAEKEKMVFAIFDSNGARAKDKDGNVIPEFTYADMVDQGNNQAKKEFKGLVKGTYTVRETSTLEIPDYTLSSSSVTEVTDSIPASDERTFHLKNIYVQDSGKLVLKKNFANGSALNSTNMTAAQRKKITFTVTGPNNYRHVYTYDDIYNADGALTLSELPVGTYHVVESADNVDGYECTSATYSFTVDGQNRGTGNIGGDIAVEKDKNSEALFTNNYRQKKGALKLTKEFDGDGVTDALKNNVTFTITGPNNYSRTVTYAEIASGSITISNLPVGTYTIKENGVASGNGTKVETFIDGGTTASTTLQTTASVTDGETAQTTYKNVYTKVGSLKIIKKVTGDKNYKNFREKKSKATVTITGPNGYTKTVTINSTNFGTGADGVYTINNLPIGNYTVTEGGNADFTNFTRVTTYDGDVSGTGTSTPGTSKVKFGETAEITVNNDYSQDKGTIKIKKIVTGDIASVAAFKAKFTDPNTVLFTISNGTNSYSVKVSDLNENGEYSIDVPVGNNYTVEEIHADLADYIRTTTVRLDGNSNTNKTSPFSVAKDSQHEAEFTNNYVNSGKLKITKSYVGALSAAEQSEVNKKLRFKILDADHGDSVVTLNNGQSEFTLAEMLKGIDLPTGNYKVVESGDEYKPEIYTHGENDVWSMLVTGDNEVDRTYGHTSAAKPVTAGNESYIYFYNQYLKIGVGVTVVKYVIIDGQGVDTDNPDPGENQFTAEQRRVENYVKDHIRFVVYAGTSATGTPIGTYAYRAESITPAEEQQGVKPVSQLVLEPGTYTIVETNYDVDNYTASVLFYVSGSIKNSPVKSTDHKVTFTVVAGGHIGIDITNGYTGYGKLVVKKAFGASSQLNNENLTEAQKKAIQFKVTGYKNAKIDEDGNALTGNEIVFGPETFSYFDMANGQKVFEKVPTGVYIVKETNGTGISTLYKCTKTTEPDGNLLIELGDEKEITFTNTYTRKLGNLEVVKTFAGDPLNSDCDLSKMTFTVTGPDGYTATKTYDEFTDGKWTINNLPTGTYTVKETGADYEDQYYERTTTVKVGTDAETAYDDAAGASGAVPEDDTLTINLINSYKEVGALIFNKSFVDDAAINKLTDAQKAAVAFTVKDSTGATIATITYAQIKAAVDAGEPGYKILVDAPADYTIVESADIAGYERTTTVKVNAQTADYDETTGVSAHVDKFTSSTVDFTNEYKEAGKLVVTKSISYTGNLTEEQQKEFKFTVTDPDGNVLKDADGNEIGVFTYYDMVKNSTGKVGTMTFENLPAGTYHIKEEVLHEGDDQANPFYGLVRTTTITVGTDKTNGLEADFNVTKDNTNVLVTNTYADVPPLTVVKRGGGYPTKTTGIGGLEYPIWKFTLDISNLSVATTTNGTTEIKDTYDVLFGDSDLGIRPEYFKTLTAAEAAQYVGDADANKLIPVDTNGNANGVTVTISENGTNGSTIKIEGVSDTTTPHHTLTFYLMPKDADSLGLLNLSDDQDEAGEESTEVVKSFYNNIQYKELPLSDWTTQKTPVEYNYRYEMLHKEAENYNAEKKSFFDPANPDQVVNYAVYRIVMNPEAKWMGDQNQTKVDCKDEFSDNQYVDESTIKFYTYDENDQLVETTVDYNMSGNVITFKIDNGKRYEMTYHAEILYTADDLHHTMEVWNKMQMNNKWVRPNPEFVPESLGDASVDYIKLRKTDRVKSNVTLAGAQFELYGSVADAEAGRNCMGTYTTGANGICIIQDYSYTDEEGVEKTGHIYANKDKVWALKEVVAPPGYELINYIVQVRLANRTKGETADPSQFIYLPSTAVGVKDKPYEGKVELGALKELIGSNVDVAAGDYEFTLTGIDGAPTGKAASDSEPAPTAPVTKANDANGKVRFGEIVFRTTDLTPIRDANGVITGYEPTTFKYTIKEEPGDKDGVTYDTTEHTVEVKVTSNDEDDTLDVEVKIDGKVVTAGENDVYYANISNEYNAEGSLVLGAKKTIKGRKLRVEEFTFEAALNDADNTVVSAKNAAENVYDCDIVFPQIDYVLDESDEAGYKDTTKVVKEDDTYTVHIDPDVMNKTDGDGHRYVDYQYTIKEDTKTPIKGVTYDETEYPVTVRVTDLDNGDLKITVMKNNTVVTDFFSNFVFKNYYSAEGEAKPAGKKFVENDDQKLEAGTYEFNVYDITDGETLLGKVTHAEASAANAGAAIQFPTIKAVVKPTATDDELGMKVVTGNSGYVKEIVITYRNYEDFLKEDGKTPKEFKFKFNELHGGEIREGIQYSDVSYEVTATVTMNEKDESVLDVNLSKTKELDFTNTPMKAEGQATPAGKKVLNGKTLKDGDFTFDLYYGTKVIGHVTNEAGGKIKYPVIKFVLDAAGTEGVTVDSENDTAVVTVTVRNPGKLAGPYTFTVMENSDKPKAGITYPLYPNDRKTFTATAKMKEGSNEEIVVTLSDADALDFTNTYGANGEDKPEGKKVLEGRKLKAREFWFRVYDADGNEIGRVTNDLNGKILYPTFKYVVDSKAKAGRELETANGALTAVIITVNKVEDLKATTYTVDELEESEAGITYDTKTKQTITVTPEVDPDDESKLKVTAEAEEGKVFTNTYTAAGQAKPSGFKELTNRLPDNEEFQFEIKEGDKVIATVKNTDSLNDEQNKKAIDYPTFKYTVDSTKDAGTTYDEASNTITVNVKKAEDLKSQYNYTISEVIPEGADETTDGKYIYKGVTYDTTVIDLTVNVAVNQDDKSRLTVTIDKATGNDFTNEYDATGAMELTAEKTLFGRILNSGEFTFRLKDEQGNTLQEKKNVKNAITFDRITYTLDDMDKDAHGFVKDTVYNYTVSEVDEGADGVTYDKNVYGIKVTLHDNKDGTINVKVEDEFGSLIDAILAKYKFKNAFENFYNAKGEGEFSGTKTLRGREIKNDDDETVFTFKIKIGTKEFTLTNTGNQIKYPKLKFVVDSSLKPGTVLLPAWENENHETIVVKAADLENIINVKDATADPVEYEPKDYEFTVTEETGNAAGITYDTKSYAVKATVSLNAKDKSVLDVNVETTPADAKNVNFVNTYRAKGEDTGEGTKFLYGREIKAKEFAFTIADGAGKAIGTVVNDANGVIQYPVFKYVVDPDAVNLGLTTEKDADGNLTAVIKTYASKEDLEKDLTATYTVKENVGTETGITYDGTTVDTINVAVEVTKEEIETDVAKLNVTVTTDSSAKFTNYYKARGEKSITGSKELTYRLPEDEEFEFVISEKIPDQRGSHEIARVKSSDMINEGYTGKTIKYPTFRYIVDYQAEAGTVYDAKNNVIIVTVNWVEDLKNGFTYTIKEVNDGQTYFTYDTTEITLNVTVTPTDEEIEPRVAKLDVAIEKSEGNDFHNKYHAKGALQLYAEKTLLGRLLNRDDFTFDLKRTDETFENVIETVDTKTNTREGSVTFDLIEYDLDSMDKDEHGYVKDTKYYYTVNEVVPEGAVENEDGTYTYNGVTYDPAVFQITATLHDNKKGLIEVSVDAKPEGELTFVEKIFGYEFKFGNAFVNFYHAEGEDTISGTKTLRGRNLTDGEYQFEIKDADGNVLATVSNNADGTINYPVFRYVVNHLAEENSYAFDKTNNTLTLTTNNLEDMVTPVIPAEDAEEGSDLVTYEPKDYIYTIDEVIPEGAKDNGDGTYTYKGVTYNELVNHYDLTATVAVNADDMGILDVSIEPNEGLDFINTYRAKGEDTVVGEKILKGADIKDYEGMFSFTVSDGEGNLITTVTNDAEGKILYPTFRYVVDPDAEAGAVYDEEENVYTVTVNAYEDLAEVYRFTVTEVEGDLEDMAYNVGEKLEYEITVTVVADDEDPANLNVVALPNTAVDFVNRQYFKAGLYKVSENSGEALKGAVIRLVRVDDGEIIDEWTTDGSIHIINLIEIGTGTFRFVEVKSPSGYHLAKSIEFTMSEDGEFSSTYDHIYDDDGNAIFIMRDPKDASTGDEAPLAAAGGAFAVGLAGLAAVLAQRKKRRA